MAYDQSTRQLMQNAGYDSDKIGFDPNSGYVQYRGVNFMKPQINQAGTTFTDQPSFTQANQSFKQNYGWLDSPDNNLDMNTRLAKYASDPTAGQSEAARADKVYNYMNSIGNQQGADEAQQYRNRIMYAMGQNPNQSAPNPQDQQISNLIGSVLQRVQNPQPYDVYNSPEFKANQDYSNLMAKQAIGNGLEAFGASGMARSSDAQRFAQNTQNEANQRLLAQVVPQLIQQHNAVEQQQTGNLMGLISPLMQQRQNQFNNQMAIAGLTGEINGQKTLAGRNADLNNAQVMAELTGKMPDGTPTNAAQQQHLQNLWSVASTMGVIPDELAQLYGIPSGTPTIQAKQIAAEMAARNASLGIEGMNAQTAASRLSWEQNPNNPDNIYKKSSAARDDAMAQSYMNNKNSTMDQAYVTALDMAMKDPMFSTKSPEDQQKAVDNLYNILKKKSGGSNDPAVSNDDIAQYLIK